MHQSLAPILGHSARTLLQFRSDGRRGLGRASVSKNSKSPAGWRHLKTTYAAPESLPSWKVQAGSSCMISRSRHCSSAICRDLQRGTVFATRYIKLYKGPYRVRPTRVVIEHVVRGRISHNRL